VVRRFRYLAAQARKEHQLELLRLRPENPSQGLSQIQFDDLETSEHTKCKPLSVALAVEPRSRKILAFSVSQMPSKGRLARISRRK